MHEPDGAPSFARLSAKTTRGNTCTPAIPRCRHGRRVVHEARFESEFSYALQERDPTLMITRRTLVLTGATGLAAAVSCPVLAAPPSPNDPVAIINAIYARAAKGKGDGGGAFIIENQAAKAKYLSKR
jgi:hypothetical protein